MSAAGGGGVYINIGGGAEGLQAAAQQGEASLAALAAAYRQQTEQITVVTEAYRMLGASQAEAIAGMLRGAEGTEVYGASLTAAREQMRMFAAQQQEVAAQMRALAVENNGGVFGTAVTAVQGLGGAFDWLGGKVFGFLNQMGSMAAGMTVFAAFGWAQQQVQNLASELVNLNTTMQSQYVGWSYLFGGLGMGEGGATGPNYGAASSMLAWTGAESYNLPYTRQDMDQAVMFLQMAGLDQAGIEHYMPILADLGVRRPGLTLSRIAQAVLGAQMGMPRMLKYELAIPDQALVPYGLDMNSARSIDPSTLLPALGNYAQAQGYYNPTYDAQGNLVDQGASYAMAHSTFTGAMTSWQDRYQNWLLQLGGTQWNDQIAANATPGMVRNPLFGSPGPQGQAQYIHRDMLQAGDIRQGSMMDDMIRALNAVTDWWDHHQNELNAMADLFGNGIGGGLQAAGKGLQGFLEGLQHTSIGTDVLGTIQGVVAWLADPKNQAQLEHLGYVIGTQIGDTLKDAAQHATDLGTAWGKLLDALGNGDKAQGITTILGALGNIVDWVIDRTATLVDMWSHLIKGLEDFGAKDFGGALGEFGAAMKDMLNDISGGIIPTGPQGSGSPKAPPASASPPPPWIPNPHTHPGGGGGGGGPAAATYGGGYAGGYGTSYGSTNINNFIYGADAQTVQALVNLSTSGDQINAKLKLNQPGVGRYHMTGLVY